MPYDMGAIWISLVLHVRKWTFGIHIDVWLTGCDFMVGLGPISPRFQADRSGCSFTYKMTIEAATAEASSGGNGDGQ